jgi:phospholipid N-methyltransferase
VIDVDGKILFFSTFLKYPKEIGSVVPSSKFLINELLKNIDFKNARCIAEYGPGTGCITSEILKRARKDAKILCFEINKKFCNYLRKNIKDERLVIINDSAENIKKNLKKLNIAKVDYVVSGLPFSTLPNNKKSIIIEETKNTLKNEGKFVIYQFLNNFKKYLYNHFSKISISFIPLNIPPCFVYVCEK